MTVPRARKLDIVILTGRPAAGKSEIIAYLKAFSADRRREDLGLGEIQELDDFPYVWETFEIDVILAKHGRPRAFTDSDYSFKDDRMMWTLFLERINLEFKRRLARDPKYLETRTLFIEFARGGATAIRDALETLDPSILERAALLYLDVSYEESLRKNRRRARPGQEDSILYHSLSDDKMARYYRINDWPELSGGLKQGSLPIEGVTLPFAVFDNENDQTSDVVRLEPALREVIARLHAQVAILGK